MKDFFYMGFMNSFCSINKSGYSFFFHSPKFFNICYENIINVFILSTIETFSDKRCFGFRPFRTSEDVFIEIKSLILKKSLIFNFSSKTPLAYTVKGNYWLLKNFPFEKTFLKSWIIKSDFDNPKIFDFSCRESVLHFSFLNFLLNGLVRFRDVN